MSYKKDIPQAQVSPKDSAADIQGNFLEFSTIFNRTALGINYNHGALNSKRQGKHEVVLMEKQSSDPVITQALTVLYTKDAVSKAGTQPQLFLRVPKFLPNNGENPPVQLTYNTVNTAGPVYQSFLPGGYLLFFGFTINTGVNITLSPSPTKILMAQAAPNVVIPQPPWDAAVQITQPDTLTIKTNAPIGSRFSWIAIGSV